VSPATLADHPAQEDVVKVRVERDVLAENVAWAARTLPNRPPLPVLASLSLDAAEGGITLSSFDQDVSSRAEVAADVLEPGRILVHGRLFADIARSLPSALVEMQTEASRVVITCGRASFTLPTLPVEEYPTLPTMPAVVGSVPGSLLAAAVAQVAVAAGKDDTLPPLTGIRVEVEGSTITLAATDRYRLAVRELSWAPASPSAEYTALVPARTLAETAKALADAADVLIALGSGGVGEGLMGFEGAGRRTTTRLLEGEFPKYRTLLPSESSAIATVDTAALIEAVKRVALVAERNTPVTMRFSESEVVLRAGAGEDARADDVLECALVGDPIDIAFNPTFLQDGLSALDSSVSRFAFTATNRPAVLSGGEDASASYRYLLMPVRLTG
jgi:DNA polymerase-3 subunit beta